MKKAMSFILLTAGIVGVMSYAAGMFGYYEDYVAMFSMMAVAAGLVLGSSVRSASSERARCNY